jgi:3-hydroxyisobutyrate dehydrogenase-like beta-hydroxyacid dehydrogenase
MIVIAGGVPVDTTEGGDTLVDQALTLALGAEPERPADGSADHTLLLTVVSSRAGIGLRSGSLGSGEGRERMERVGVIGLGNIGGAIAANLVADGHSVTVSDVDPARASAVIGAEAVGDAAAVAAASEITITSLPTPEAVAGVAEQWVQAAPTGAILLDISTSAPPTNRELAARLQASGRHFVEAPLTGGAVGARKRSLVFMVGGDDEAVARCRPLLDKLGRATFHLGPVGAGTTMKLANSLLAFSCTWASLEALSLAAAAGLDLRAAVDVVRTGGASNFFMDHLVDGIDTRGRPPQFSLTLAAKDARLIDDLASASGVPAPVARAVRQILADAVERGLGEHDWSDLVLSAEARAGLELTLGPAPEPGGGTA